MSYPLPNGCQGKQKYFIIIILLLLSKRHKVVGCITMKASSAVELELQCTKHGLCGQFSCNSLQDL